MNYINKIKGISRKDIFEKQDLMVSDFLISSYDKIKIYYAPFEFINHDASVIIVGITPGWTQMELAYRTFINAKKNNLSDELAFIMVKSKSSFAGTMRNNLISMLDDLRLHKKLQIKSSSELFDVNNNLLHTTSLLKYPVFVSDKNYSGSNPKISTNKFLLKEVDKNFVSEINNFKNKLIIPLGKNVNEVITKLIPNEKLDKNYLLSGFPHPSGANGHRLKDFDNKRLHMSEVINNWHI